MIHFILFGPPGSGKGTQAQLLVDKYHLKHISTGDLFRKEIGEKTPLGLKATEYINRGELVPDEVTIGMLRNAVEAAGDVNGFIFDGFPRTTAQAEALDAFLSERNEAITALIELMVSDEEIVGRLLERGKTSGRADDSDEGIIRNRITVYKDSTTPVAAHYAAQDKALQVVGLGSIQEVAERLHIEIDCLVKQSASANA